jgi:nitroimidazol reductase NimA-like FMN-containing flavoprotein (pyridoxamine 5'-phosphate oxidase superfamily)
VTDPAATARAIIDATAYMVLGTADEAGHPWVSPVWFAPAGYSEFIWVSRPETRHSLNIAARPELSIVIFDSTVPIDSGQGVYMSAAARQLPRDEWSAALETFNRRSLAQGGTEWTLDDVQSPAPLRLYAASASEHWILEGSSRVPVTW